MSTPNDGGPAFPLADSCCEYGNTNRSAANGMSLRDNFACKAMQGELAAMVDLGNGVAGLDLDIDDDALEELTSHWYRIADAMLKARSKA